MRDEAKVVFQDGMRVTRQHLDHLQDTLLADVIQLRDALGAGHVCYGLRTEAMAADRVKISAGLAFDGQGRPVFLDDAAELAVNVQAGAALHLALLYSVRSEGIVNGHPTLLYHRTSVEARPAAPPYEDGAVVFARLERSGETLQVYQNPAWYLTAADHRHSGQFREDSDGRWRYDGVPLGFGDPRFDSGFVTVPAAGQVRLIHGLNTTNALIELQARRTNGVITTRGKGQLFWYELAGNQEVTLVRDDPGGEELALRVMMWPFGAPATGLARPIAIVTSQEQAEYGQAIVLDGAQSRSFDGKPLRKYIWTQLT